MTKPFSEEQVEQILRMVAQAKTVEEIASAFGLHRTTLERSLTKNHKLQLETMRCSRLVRLTDDVVLASPGFVAPNPEGKIG